MEISNEVREKIHVGLAKVYNISPSTFKTVLLPDSRQVVMITKNRLPWSDEIMDKYMDYEETLAENGWLLSLSLEEARRLPE